MRCYICGKAVFGPQGISVPKYGPAHRECYEATQTIMRTFRGLEISELSDDELTDLHDLVLAELNHRKGDDDDIELF